MKLNKYIFVKPLLLSLLALGMVACVEDHFPDYVEDNNGIKEKESAINITFTLDRMGGTRSTVDELEKIQNYVDPEKFRVLFFDDNDKFLFESKSRWVRIRQEENNFISWQVSVPFFDYGNDTEFVWDWEIIKQKLMSKKFKIALLVNRPESEYYPGFVYTKWENNPRWFDNSGPHWKRVNSMAYKTYLDSLEARGFRAVADSLRAKVGEPQIKDIFDIHHSQYDPIYDGKDYAGSTSGYYRVVMGEYNTEEPQMSSTSSWAKWEENCSHGWDRRPAKLPDYDYPIPMYGVQEYDSITPGDWLDGTTFSLERPGKDFPITLLRSVVRLDLYVPKNVPLDYMALYYVNPYARCEPMNNWTPMEKLWVESRHDTVGLPNFSGTQGLYPNITTCDESRLMAYGPITENGTTGDEITSRTRYWEKLAWMYGAWLEKSDVWKWGEESGLTGYGVNWAKGIVEDVKRRKGIDPPQIMNACIQRNNILVLEDESNFDDDPLYHHYIAYVGERHTNAPSALQNIGNTGSGNPTVFYWTFGVTGGARYSVALGDFDDRYGKGSNNAFFKDIAGEPPANGYGNTYPSEPGNNMGIQGGSHGSGFMPFYQDGSGPGPLPMIRNHIYTVKLRRSDDPNTRSGDDLDNLDFIVETEVKRSPTIDFSDRVIRVPANQTPQQVGNDGMIK